MKQNIRFSHNWNNKLQCKSFTTFRRANADYAKGKIIQVVLNGENLGLVRIENIRPMSLDELLQDEYLCWSDFGYSSTSVRNIIDNMYPGVNKSENVFVLLLLVHV